MGETQAIAGTLIARVQSPAFHEYEMACGHCRRPRKEILASNFDQLCWVRGLSSSPKSQGGPKAMLRGSKMAPEITSWDAKNSPGRPEAQTGPPLALPAPRQAPGSVRAAADCTPPGGRPSDAANPSASQPTSPPTPPTPSRRVGSGRKEGKNNRRSVKRGFL